MSHVDPCPACKSREGWEWKWSKGFDNKGFSICKKCKKEFH